METILLLIVALVATVILGPLVLVWAVATLVHVPPTYDFWTWLAGLVIIILFVPSALRD